MPWRHAKQIDIYPCAMSNARVHTRGWNKLTRAVLEFATNTHRPPHTHTHTHAHNLHTSASSLHSPSPTQGGEPRCAEHMFAAEVHVARWLAGHPTVATTNPWAAGARGVGGEVGRERWWVRWVDVSCNTSCACGRGSECMMCVWKGE